MKANRVHRFGNPDVIEFEEVEIPIPGDGEVLIRVAAAGVGPWDSLVRSGGSALGQTLPLTLGADVSGTVEAVGTSEFKFGDRVHGLTNKQFIGSYAEYAVVSSKSIAHKPQRLTAVESAAVPVVAVTALQMLDRAGVSADSNVLIHGAAGGVGSIAVQLAALRGANVVATVNGDDVDYVKSLGAGLVLDVRRTPFESTAKNMDAVLDTVGGDVQARSFKILKHGGTLISAVSVPDKGLANESGVDATWLLVDVTTRALETINGFIDDGRLRVLIGTTLSLAEAREAHEMLAGTVPRPRGKIVLRALSSA